MNIIKITIEVMATYVIVKCGQTGCFFYVMSGFVTFIEMRELIGVQV